MLRSPWRTAAACGGSPPGGLADPLLGDRGQRVVVELGHQQTRSRDHQGDQEPPAGVGAGHDRDQQQHPDREQRESQPDDAVSDRLDQQQPASTS